MALLSWELMGPVMTDVCFDMNIIQNSILKKESTSEVTSTQFQGEEKCSPQPLQNSLQQDRRVRLRLANFLTSSPSFYLAWRVLTTSSGFVIKFLMLSF